MGRGLCWLSRVKSWSGFFINGYNIEIRIRKEREWCWCIQGELGRTQSAECGGGAST
jgi:hypothetical protein